jgi:hypothetical protein
MARQRDLVPAAPRISSDEKKCCLDLVGIYLPVASPNVSFCHECKANVPKTVQTTILLVLAALFDDRNGSGEGDYFISGVPVARLLIRHRDSAIA